MTNLINPMKRKSNEQMMSLNTNEIVGKMIEN